MDSLRYVLALVTVVSVPPAFGFWLLIHPFARFWRTVGAGWAYAVATLVVAAGMLGIYRLRRPLLSVEFGTSWPLVGLGLGVLVLAIVVGVQFRRQMGIGTQMGLPELAPERHPPRLLTQGIYSRLRHPRYVSLMLGLLAWSLVSNYLVVYAILLLGLPAIHLVVLLEERELRGRFGADYVAYSRRVPRYLPRRARRRAGA